ncbi:MAG: ABC transporter permease [Pseudobdellovibrionaceae bacterium]
MQKNFHFKSSTFISDGLIILFLGALIFGISSFGHQWDSSYNPNYQIDLSYVSLPKYAAYSALRGFVAYLISLLFTLLVGYWAASSARAEKIILPFLDVMQSIPVLGFLPGLVLGLVSLFPKTNIGLEMAAILMIFSGQVWNMTFAFYASLKSVPMDLKEAGQVMKLSAYERLKFLELPFSAMTLTWNSVMSMAGGWFFLTVCEAFTLGNQTYRLPGLGAYMAVAIEAGATGPILAGILAMFAVILFFDLLLWRPALVWAHGYRLEEGESQKMEEPFIQLIVRRSLFIRFLRKFYHSHRNLQIQTTEYLVATSKKNFRFDFKISPLVKSTFNWTLGLVALVFITYGSWQLLRTFANVNLQTWSEILRDTFFTFLRVVMALLIGTLWAMPAAIWIAQSPKRLQWAQPLIQLLASFPAPMLYPLALGLFIYLKINFEVSSMLLMLLGVQWYILFNVLAGALRIPTELRLSMKLMRSSTWDQWRFLFLPSVLPALVTGWVTAAGGAWNASIVSELIVYRGSELKAHGLGAQISQAAAAGDFSRLAVCLFVMILFVVLLNRTFWVKLHRLTQLRYRMDL